MSKTKLYYKIPTLSSVGKVFFNDQLHTIKTEALTRIAAVALKEFAEAETHGITRRMGTVFIPDEDYNEAREEIKFSSTIEKRSDNDYICIYNGNSEMIVMIRPTSTRQISLMAFEAWEESIRKELKEREKFKDRYKETVNTPTTNEE